MKPLLSFDVPIFSRRSMAAASYGSNIYFFGGVGATGTESILDVSSDLFCFDTRKLRWRQIQQTEIWPSARRCVGWTRVMDRMLLWGGSGVERRQDSETLQHTFLNDEWVFDPATETWQVIKLSDDHRAAPLNDFRPSPRYTPILHDVEGEQFLFGGYTEDRFGKRKLNDTWLNSGGVWSMIPAYGKEGYGHKDSWPGLRYGAMSAADKVAVYVFGGFSDDGDHNDLWRFDLSSRRWNQLAPDITGQNFPQARYCAAFAIYGNCLFMFGGRSRRYPKLNFNDLWVFDLKDLSWIQLRDNSSTHLYSILADYPGYHAKSSSSVVGKFWYIWGGEGACGHVSDFWRFDLSNFSWQLIQAARKDDPKFW